MPSTMSEKRYLTILLLIAAASLWMRAGFPVSVVTPSPNDDQLFVQMARSLAEGRWLGGYTNVTLVKGMFYPIFIAVSFFAGIPLKIAEQAAYLGASALTAEIVRRRANNRPLGVTLFIFLAFTQSFGLPASLG